MLINELLRKLRALVQRRRAERELRDELDFHVDMQARKHMTAGMGPAEARRRARAEFGSVELAKEDSRDVRQFRPLEELGQDIRYALRGIRRAPTFAITVVVTIALGLGLNTAVFSIFNAYVLRPIAVRDPNALYAFGWVDVKGRGHQFRLAEFEQLRAKTALFSDVLAQRFIFARVDGQPTFGEVVTDDYFTMLGIGAALGRTILPGDAAAPHTGAIAVLSHKAWKSRYGGDSAVVGKTMIVRGVSLTIVGVAREGFGGLEEVPRDIWVPVSMMPDLDPSADVYGPAPPALLQVVVRLAPGVSVTSAGAPLLVWARDLSASDSAASRATNVVLESRATPITLSPKEIALFSPVLLAFALVLVIACANVANMMLARGMARQREIGIRLSLGAGRSRLVRQLLTESVILAVPAALLGFVISIATLDLATRAMFATIPPSFGPYIHIVPLQPDARVFAFILAAAVGAAILFSLAPALQATRPSVVHAAKGNFDAEHRPSRLRNGLVIAQVTAAALLLICSSILLRNSHRLERIESGIRTTDVLQLDLVPGTRARALARIRAFPGVDAIAAASRSPVDGSFNEVPLMARGGRTALLGYFSAVSSGYFSVLEIPVVEGRNFTVDEEAAGAPVVIVSQALARRLWPGRSAVGETITFHGDTRFRYGGEHPLPHEATVIGVARDAVSGVIVFGIDRPTFYFPTNADAEGPRLLLRVHGDAGRVAHALDAELERALPGSVEQIHPLDEFVAASLYGFTAAYWVSSAIGAIALLLTLTGVYGVLSYLVTQRSREIGIRLALGATARGVSALVLRQSLRLALIGLAAGTLLTLAASRIIASGLSFMEMFDPVAYAGGATIVLAACLVAAFIPSRRAARVDPVVMLRED